MKFADYIFWFYAQLLSKVQHQDIPTKTILVYYKNETGADLSQSKPYKHGKEFMHHWLQHQITLHFTNTVYLSSFKWNQPGAHYFLVYLFQLFYMFRATMCPT